MFSDLGHLGGPELPGVDGIGLASGEPQKGAAPVEPHDDGRVGLLHGLGREGGAAFEAVVVPLELGLLLRPERLEDADALLELFDAAKEVEHLEAVGFEVGVLVGGADTEDSAPAGEGVDARDLLGELEGVVEGHARDVGTQAHVLRYPAVLVGGAWAATQLR